MIDIENIVLRDVSNYCESLHSGLFVSPFPIAIPERLPCLAIYESDNYVYTPSETIGKIENYAQLMYTVDIYSNLINGAKTECKSIAKDVDTVMAARYFRRTMKAFTPNYYPGITRLTMRYIGICDSGTAVQTSTGTDTIYKIYN